MNRRNAVKLGITALAAGAITGGNAKERKPRTDNCTSLDPHLDIIAEAINDLPDDIRFMLMEETSFYLSIIRLPITVFEDGSVITHEEKFKNQ